MKDEDAILNKIIRKGLIMKVAFGQRDLKGERVPAMHTSGERGSQEREDGKGKGLKVETCFVNSK